LRESHNCLLSVDDLVTGYGKRQVLKGVSLSMAAGDIIALIGHNGAGKSTLLKTIFGLIPIWEGRVLLAGQVLEAPNPRKLLHAGVAYVPQGNRIFADLTVRENLEMGGDTVKSKRLVNAGIERVFTLFPVLKPRLNQRAGILSGGEKQMLALSSALVLAPRILLLDEPSLGLAPPMVSKSLAEIARISKSSSLTVLIVEQKVREVLKIAQRVCVLRNGAISFSGLSADLSDDTKLREVYL
jgi:ABC-type branched-subunit amino acid transport system ATPase component